MLTVGSLCSGAGGMDLGFHQAGHRTLWMCEIDEWRRRLLAARFGVLTHPDLTTLDPADLESVDVLIGGTPCQDLSVAGQRVGLDGERSGLFWHFMRVRSHLGAEWTVWENVAGALSSNQGLDFARVLGAFVGADVNVPAGGWPGTGVAAGPWGGAVWRVLDAQHFGVPQRRRRVFVVGCLGGPCPPSVLLEPTGGDRDPAAGRSAGAGVADPLDGGPTGALRSHCRPGSNSLAGLTVSTLQVEATYVVSPDTRSDQRERGPGDGAHDDGAPVGIDGAPPDADRVRAVDGLARRVDGAPVSFAQNQRGEVLAKPIMDSLKVGGGKPGQGYPAVLGAGSESDTCAYDPQPDGRRYAACGDGVVANVAEWIARRLATVIDRAAA